VSVFKDNWNGYDGKRWRVSLRYTDWQGKKKQHDKRGFETKKDALAYERDFLAKKSKDINMGSVIYTDLLRDGQFPCLIKSFSFNSFNIPKSYPFHERYIVFPFKGGVSRSTNLDRYNSINVSSSIACSADFSFT